MTTTALDQALQTLEQATSTPELVKATQALCALNDLEAAKPLVKVLGFNNPAVAAVATPVSYTHLRAHETEADLVCRLLLEKKK